MALDLREELQQAIGERYAIERELGRGGMGAVFLGRDLALDRPVAIKVLPPELAVRGELRERFLRETRTAASFSHPNIVPIHAVEQHEGILAFVMGYIEGETLAQRIRRMGSLPPAEVVRLLQEMAWALSYAHGRQVIHRDVKPDNILIDRGSGRAMLMDFGIARSSAAAGLTAVGEVVGTPHYMSPEQASGDNVDGRSDLYSLGIVAFSALTGRVPFDAASTPAILAMQITRAPPSLAAERPDLPAALVQTIERLLIKDPAERFQTGEALGEALDAARVSRPEVAPAIRLFAVKANQFLRNAVILAIIGPVLVQGPHYDGDRFIMATIVVVAVISLLLQIPVGMRELARQGFRHSDLRSGLGVIDAEEGEARVQLRNAPDFAGRRKRKFIALGVTVVIGAALIRLGLSLRREIRPGFYSSTGAAMITTMSGFGLLILAMIFAIASGRGAGRVSSALSHLWSGPVGRGLFNLASRGIGGARTARATSSATTLSGGRAALEVFEALPKELRRQLGTVDASLRSLETEDAALIKREADLRSALSEATRPGAGGADDARRQLVDEIDAAKRQAAERRAAIAGTQERVRLELLRLRSGLGTPAAVTHCFEDARG